MINERVDQNNKNKSKKSLVIGAGYGRTGTVSLMTALEMLDYNPCFHMRDVFLNPKYQEMFNKKFKNIEGYKIPFNEIFEKYSAAVDHPMCLFWEEILEEFPDSKVILTVRSGESWYKSMSEIIIEKILNNTPYFLRFVALFYRNITDTFDTNKLMFKYNFKNDFSKENLINTFEQHNKYVIEKCPKDKLLVFEVKDGWKPLCEFLGKDIPNVDFPKRNEGVKIKRNLKLINIVIIFVILAILALIVSKYIG